MFADRGNKLMQRILVQYDDSGLAIDCIHYNIAYITHQKVP